ncbi:MAG: AMP-binding protein [Myxococcota bacterium]|jgi:O-succinylbenzoic acid--CoA ligase|nr:AMP-binding protein [Myxococcota bacterium]
MRSGCPLAAAAQAHGSLPALLTADHCWSFEEWHQATSQAAAALARTQLKVGDRVAVCAPSTGLAGIRQAVLFFAAWRRGLVVCPVSPRLPVDALRDRLDVLETQVWVHHEDMRLSTVEEATVLDELVPLDGTTDEPLRIPDPGDLDPDALATLLWTSGSTGHPRAAGHRLSQHLASARASHDNVPFGPGCRWLASLSLHHVGGLSLLFRAIHGGGAVAFPSTRETILDSLLRLGPTHLSLVSVQLHRLLQRLPENARSEHPIVNQLSAVLVGGGPAPSTLLREAWARGVPVLTTYGSTETASQVSTSLPGEPPAHPPSAGFPLGDNELRIDAGGELHIRGPSVLLGYWSNGRLHPATDPQGWYRTGDLAAWSDQGQLLIAGRSDLRFTSGGESIHPETIERALYDHPEIEQALVVPVPREPWGYRPVLIIRPAEGSRCPSLPGIKSYLRDRLVDFLIPDAVLAWPMNLYDTEQKPDRKRLQIFAQSRVVWNGC